MNTINLNENFWNNLGFKWQNMVETFGWKIDNMYNGIERLSSIKYVYNMEISNSSNYKIYSNKIGLMYVSDYGYAASPENWTINLENYLEDYNNVTDNNWLYLRDVEWTITPYSSHPNYVFNVEGDGNYEYANHTYLDYSARPSLYLKSNVYVVKGKGTLNAPYIIGM